MHSNKSEALDSISAGDIAVLIGLKLSQTGDTLGNEGAPVLLENLSFPQPVISVALEPETLSDRDKLKETLDILSKEDPTFTFREDAETGQLLISGMGELHLEVLVTRMKKTLKSPPVSEIRKLPTANRSAAKSLTVKPTRRYSAEKSRRPA